MSLFSLSRWRPVHLLASWVAYWVALLLVTLGPAIPAVLRATRSGGHGEVSANFGNGVLSFVVKEAGRTTFSGSVPMLTAALWLAVPPLVIWTLWLYARGTEARTRKPVERRQASRVQ
jgi:hypothetical protein